MNKKKRKNKRVIDNRAFDIVTDKYDIQAENEAIAISKAYRSKTIGFGKRINKRHGQKHVTPHYCPIDRIRKI